MMIKTKKSNDSLAANEKIWTDPTDSPLYKGGPDLRFRYTGCDPGRQPDKKCKLQEAYNNAEIPAYGEDLTFFSLEPGRPEFEGGGMYPPIVSCDCTLARGGHDIGDWVIDRFSHSKVVKRIRALQQKAETLRVKEVPLNEDGSVNEFGKMQLQKDIKRTNKELHNAIQELKTGIEKNLWRREGNREYCPDTEYYMDRAWEERCKVYPDPESLKSRFPNLQRADLHRRQDSMILSEKTIRERIYELEQSMAGKTKAEKKTALAVKQRLQIEVDELCAHMKSIGFKK